MTRRKCAKCGVTRIAKMFASERARVCNPCKREVSQASARSTRLKAKYGITLLDYKRMLERQAGKCGGCNQTRRYNLHVDHDHKVERAAIARGIDAEVAARLSVRGLLCARCNKVLRDVRDSAVNLHGLADYVDKPPAWAVLR